MSTLPSGTVTILFTDIEGSTALLQRLGDRGYRDVLNAHDRLLREVFTAHDGQIVETQGDAFLVAFRSARGAVEAAIDGQVSILRQPWPADIALRVRMGLHTGEPLSGDKGYVGLGVHRAARICSAGHGGQILLSQTTADLIGNDPLPGVTLLDLGAHRLKDLERPERMFQLLRADLPASFPALKSLPATQLASVPVQRSPLAERLRSVPLVGRAESLRRLEERLDAIRTGPRGMVLISGEPGIGKSRLLDEVVAAASARGMAVLVGRCQERNLAVPYVPVSEALEGLARSIAPAAWERLVQAAGPDIQVLLSDFVVKHRAPWGLMRSEEQAVLAVRADIRPARAVRNLLQELGRESPAVLAIDDLHWADRPTLELLHDLALSTREVPALIVGAYREVELERTHPLSRLMVDLNRERLLHRERLRRLTLPETEEFLRELLNGPAPDGLATLIHDQTEGNPFFVEEITSGLVEDGLLVWHEDASRYTLAPGTIPEQLAGEVPQGIRAAIGARLDRLDDVDQRVLSLASVIGRDFPQEVLIQLSAVHGIDEDGVEEALERARAARFVSVARAGAQRDAEGFTSGGAHPDADWAFDHALIHQVVYGELDRRRRRRLHAELGGLLERLYPGRQGLYAERLAYHYLEGDDDAKSLQYCLSAGDKMMRAYYDPDLALNYYLTALETIVGREPAHRHLRASAPVSVRRGGTQRFTSEQRDAIVAYLNEVLQTVAGSPTALAVAQLANRICVAAMHTGEVYQRSIRLYEQTLLGPNVERLTVPTNRGTLVGILELPEQTGLLPVVLMFHGSPGSKEVLADDARRYHARGLATLRVDLPGYGETTVPRTSSPADAEILKEMVTAALAHPRADPRGVGVYGISLGPWHAAQLCARDDRVRAMVGISGRFDPLETTLKGVEIPAAFMQAFWTARWKAGGIPGPAPPPWSADSSVYDVADRIRCPMLLVYGALEPEVFRVQSEKLATLVPTATAQGWRSGVHVLFNTPEAHEAAADWMRDQLLISSPATGAVPP